MYVQAVRVPIIVGSTPRSLLQHPSDELIPSSTTTYLVTKVLYMEGRHFEFRPSPTANTYYYYYYYLLSSLIDLSLPAPRLLTTLPTLPPPTAELVTGRDVTLRFTNNASLKSSSENLGRAAPLHSLNILIVIISCWCFALQAQAVRSRSERLGRIARYKISLENPQLQARVS